jgi:hypothetical protein
MTILVDIRFCKTLARLDVSAAEAALEANPAASVAVAAKLSRRSPQVIREAIRQGSLPATGKHFKLITLPDLLAWSGRTSPFTAEDLRAAGTRATPAAGPNRAERRQHLREAANVA